MSSAIELPKCNVKQILTNQGHPVCSGEECYSEEDLRNLPCDHLLCKKCIGMYIFSLTCLQ